MLLKALPIFVVVGAVLGSWLLDQPFCFRPLWDGHGPWVPKGAEAVAAAVLLALGLGLCALACRRQKKRELLRPNQRKRKNAPAEHQKTQHHHCFGVQHRLDGRHQGKGHRLPYHGNSDKH